MNNDAFTAPAHEQGGPKHPGHKAALPTLSDVPDLEQDPSLPAGFDSEPEGPGATVHSLGIAAVQAFALSFRWATSDQRKSARGWANNVKNTVSWAATLREFGDRLSDDQKRSINLSCSMANVYQAGAGAAKTFEEPIYLADKRTVIAGVAFPANFTEGSGFSGETTYELGPADAKRLAFEQLISDVQAGAHLLAAKPG